LILVVKRVEGIDEMIIDLKRGMEATNGAVFCCHLTYSKKLFEGHVFNY
jgi:hypothetical protein